MKNMSNQGSLSRCRCSEGRQIPPFTRLFTGHFEECRNDFIRRRRYPFWHRLGRTPWLRFDPVGFLGHFRLLGSKWLLWIQISAYQAFIECRMGNGKRAEQRYRRHYALATWFADGVAQAETTLQPRRNAWLSNQVGLLLPHIPLTMDDRGSVVSSGWLLCRPRGFEPMPWNPRSSRARNDSMPLVPTYCI